MGKQDNVDSNAEELLKSSKELLRLASSEPSSEGIQKILDEHSRCFSGEYCSRCQVINEELFEDLVYELAKNLNLTDKQQRAVLDLAADYQRAWEILVYNPNISDETKSEITSGGEFWHDMDDHQVTEIIEAMKANPRFTEDEIEEFRSYFEGEWGYGQDDDSR